MRPQATSAVAACSYLGAHDWHIHALTAYRLHVRQSAAGDSLVLGFV